MAVIGDFMLDRYLWGASDRISPEAPVPVVKMERQTENLGGAGNVVANIAGLGATALPVGLVGDDSAGTTIKEKLTGLGCRVDHLIVSAGRPTTTKMRVVSQGQQIVRVDNEELGRLSPDVMERLEKAAAEAIKKASVCLISDYAKGVCSPVLLKGVIGLARSRGVPVLVDPKRYDFDAYRGATCVTPNVKELFNAFHMDTHDPTRVLEAAKKLRSELGLPYLLLTQGAAGMTLVSADSDVHIPAQTRSVADVSGAGDTVIATLAVGIGSGLDYLNAAALSNVAAGHVVGQAGTVPITLNTLAASVRHGATTPWASKLVSRANLGAKTAEWKRAASKIVFTNGCFDLLHVGHVTLLNRASLLGDILVVGLNSDISVREVKGPSRPFVTETDRAKVLSALEAVDAVVIFDEPTPENLVREIRPDFLVKGADYRKEDVAGGVFVEGYGGKVELIDLVEGHSTSDLAARITESRTAGERL